jgi:DNA-binding transcriptional LysR family regulator
MTLTRAGEKLLLQAEALLAAAGELQGAARQMQGEITGRIDLGLPGESTDFLRLGLLAAGVQRDLPLVELHTHTSAVGELLDRVRGGTLAAAFSISVHPPRDLQWQALRSVSYRVAIPTVLASEMQRGGWRVLAGLPWVDGAVDSHVHQMLRGLFEQQGLAPNVALRSEDTRTLEAFVRAGSACALLREEVALPGVERREWVVWGHARVDAQLFFSSTAERASDPLVVALNAVGPAGRALAELGPLLRRVRPAGSLHVRPASPCRPRPRRARAPPEAGVQACAGRLERPQLGVGVPAMRSYLRKYLRAIATSWASLGWSVTSVPTMCAARRAVLLRVVLEVGDAGLGADDQQLGDAGERVAHLAEELVLGAHAAGVLGGVVAVRLDLLRLHVLGVELQDLGGLMVDPDHGMEHRHREFLSRGSKGGTGFRQGGAPFRASTRRPRSAMPRARPSAGRRGSRDRSRCRCRRRRCAGASTPG